MITKNKVITKKQTIPDFFKGNAPYIFAHRGGMTLRPEQTQLAFDYAKQLGVDGFETDVRLTKINSLSFFMTQLLIERRTALEKLVPIH